MLVDMRAALVAAQNRNQTIMVTLLNGTTQTMTIASVGQDAVIGRAGTVARIIPFHAVLYIEVTD